MRKNISLAILCIAITACAGYLNKDEATDVVLVCPVTIAQGTSEISVKRRFEINYDAHKVAEYIDQGSGWTPEATLELQVADHDRMVFAGDGIRASNFNQHTGEYRQVDDRGEARGTCERTSGRRLNKS
ncbi:MAG: hypothetical protein JOY77_05975 [Alphaproteobacteria bacterium]|nr:hypothetical protein [Alphaproteobacteria bacterium]MBV9725175.1 hypothetical protein [Gammaproteobacteria bacterium]